MRRKRGTALLYCLRTCGRSSQNCFPKLRRAEQQVLSDSSCPLIKFPNRAAAALCVCIGHTRSDLPGFVMARYETKPYSLRTLNCARSSMTGMSGGRALVGPDQWRINKRQMSRPGPNKRRKATTARLKMELITSETGLRFSTGKYRRCSLAHILHPSCIILCHAFSCLFW